jgi:AcrR family transcriptional regulator
VPNKRVEQGEVTRAALVAAARDLFAERGFAGTATEEIVQRASVTRGALYHHFDGKDALFRAVFESIEEEIAAAVIRAAASTTDPVLQLTAGLDAFLDLCLEPAVQRIVLLEGPTVLGWETWHEIDTRYAFGLVLAAIEGGMAAGVIRSQPVEPLAHLILGAVIQAGMVVARAEDPKQARAEMRAAFDGLLAGLRV